MSRQLCPHHPDVDYKLNWACPDCLVELRDENKQLREQLAEAKLHCISGFYEEQKPIFRQGPPTHELEDFVTAREVTAYVDRIETLKTQLAQLETRLNDQAELLLEAESATAAANAELHELREAKYDVEKAIDEWDKFRLRAEAAESALAEANARADEAIERCEQACAEVASGYTYMLSGSPLSARDKKFLDAVEDCKAAIRALKSAPAQPDITAEASEPAKGVAAQAADIDEISAQLSMWQKGIKFDKENNVYYLTWTQEQIDLIQKLADALHRKLRPAPLAE